ncbi:GNAT family N-acetyltransferase [Sphaerisporangium album]|uniref:GNAT family N-acetyltransferase n=1 Tax=Sphaerisporangium album TaxID=509200 RepID=UPI001FE9E552|nr:GNAT family protein [Sphaerisporangium album]
MTLRPVVESDLTVFDRELHSPEGRGDFQWFGYRSGLHDRRALEANGLLTDDGGTLTVCADGEVAGRVQWGKAIWGPPATSWCWTIGILIRPALQGRGIGTEAQRGLARYLFDHSWANRIEASTDIRNIAERKALEKAGFTREGVLRGALWRGGQWHDQVLYSLLRAD